MKKLKILISSETYPPDVNGVARFTENLDRGLALRGYKITVIAPGTKFKDEKIKENTNLNIFRIRSIPLKPIHPYFRVVLPFNINKKIKSIIQEFKPDIIHIQNHFTLGKTCLLQAKKIGIPIIGTNHFMSDNLMEYFPSITHKNIKNYMWKEFIKIYNQLDYVTAPSEAAISMIKKLGLKNRTEVISNGINLNRFKSVKVNKNIFNKFKINKNIFSFLFVGRLEKDKNIDLILKASKLAMKKNPFQVIIVGKGADENKLKDLSNKLNLNRKVIFTGEVSNEDLNQLYSLSNVYIGSGSAELQGIAVMEAMAHKLPILALNAVALPELVKDNLNGYLFEFNKVDLSNKMLKTLSLPKQKLKEMGKNSFKIIQTHSQEKTLEKFENLYENVINMNKRRP